ncbi:MAG TPA: helix-turn-helix domain-containing protein, partial [Longimicrobiaceae bacterium]|nr:helix-turn-helix domain-containing protein [Longimicrobiaceae bacterium]
PRDRDRTAMCGSAALEPLPTLEEAERDLIRRALAQTGGNQTEAARRLGIARNTIMRKMRQYAIQ